MCAETLPCRSAAESNLQRSTGFPATTLLHVKFPFFLWLVYLFKIDQDSSQCSISVCITCSQTHSDVMASSNSVSVSLDL